MNNYTEIKFRIEPVISGEDTGSTLTLDDAQDILSALLADIGYESFEKNGDILTAFIPSKSFNTTELEAIVSGFPFAGSQRVRIESIKDIEGEDWNHVWEKNYFKPYIFADNRCVIHSSFHKDYPECELDIVIDPKMAFGTGHHSTTRLMVEALFRSDLQGKSLLDVGTGSGILAIIASKLGADKVTAIEIDEPAYLNAIENSGLNECNRIHFILGTIKLIEPDSEFDFLLANINRNVILDDMHNYSHYLKPGGQIFLSGFYEEDVEMIIEKASLFNLRQNYFESDNRWAIIGLTNQ